MGSVVNLCKRGAGEEKEMKTRREILNDQIVGYLRSVFRNEALGTAPEEWEPERVQKVIEQQVEQSQCILDALEMRELENEIALDRHAEQAVLELRARIHWEMAADRRGD